MATIVTTGGANYSIPAYGDSNWAQGQGNLSAYLIAIASTKLDIAGGTFTLTAPLNLGATYGIIAASFTTVGGASVPACYSQAFNNQTRVTVTHNLGHYPIVQVLDSSSNVIQPDTINHGSVNAFTVSFSPALSGTILYQG